MFIAIIENASATNYAVFASIKEAQDLMNCKI